MYQLIFRPYIFKSETLGKSKMALPRGEHEALQSKHCCLIHEFYRAASKSPDKIAIIHASPSKPSANEVRIDRELINGGNPPVYKGDRCFTFANLLASVECLSFRICSVLDGADDRYLIKPQTSGNVFFSPFNYEFVY